MLGEVKPVNASVLKSPLLNWLVPAELVTVQSAAYTLWLPVGSSCTAVKLCAPAVGAAMVAVHCPLALAVVVATRLVLVLS